MRGTNRQVPNPVPKFPSLNGHCGSLMSAVVLPITNIFPDVSKTDGDGILHHPSIPLTLESFTAGYREGYFYWQNEETMSHHWYAPPERAVLDLKDFFSVEVQRDTSVKKVLQLQRNHKYQVTFDKDFNGVVRGCQTAVRRTNNRQWLTDEMAWLYLQLYRRGQAHSTEVWDGDLLVGGSFGVLIDGVFYGESMFHYEKWEDNVRVDKYDNTGRLALLYTIERLRENGITWFDSQYLHPQKDGLRMFGAKNITREEFMMRLHEVQTNFYRSHVSKPGVPTWPQVLNPEFILPPGGVQETPDSH